MRLQLLPVALFLSACSGGDGPLDVEPPPTDTTDTGELLTSVQAVLEPHGVVTCADPAARDSEGPFERRTDPHPPVSFVWNWASAGVAADFNGDGLIDMVTTHEDGARLYEFDGDGFLPRPSILQPFELVAGTGGSAADYDGDGDLDLYVNQIFGPPSPFGDDPDTGCNRLLQNQGNGTFVDVTEQAGGVEARGLDPHTDTERCLRTMTSSWGDIDHDGDLDLFVGNYGWVDPSSEVKQVDFQPAEPSFLYLNDGDGTFTDASDLLPQELHDGYIYTGGFFDLDADGWLDLYTVNDFGAKFPNRVLWNRQGTLTFDPADATGLTISMEGMGLGVGDLNGDGLPELAIADWRANVLLESRADLGVWIRSDDTRGYVPDLVPTGQTGQHIGWGSDFADVDNDGDLDIVQQFGFITPPKPQWETHPVQPDALYIHEPTGEGEYTLTDRAEEWGVADTTSGRGVIIADLNRDGWLDLAKRVLDGPDIVHLSRCGDEGWLEVHLRQPGTLNHFAVGGVVEVEHDGRVQTRTIVAGGTSLGVGGPPEVHFGFGEADTVDRVTVRWPDGEVTTFTDVTLRQQVTVTR